MIIYIIIVFFAVCLTVMFLRNQKFRRDIYGEHFMITGGSSGIGLAFAMEVVRRGASVTLVARDKNRLSEAKDKLSKEKLTNSQKIQTFSLDISSHEENIISMLNKAEELLGPVTFLVNCAGTSVCYRFEDTPVPELEKMVKTNWMGSVLITQAVLPGMKDRRGGNIIFVSSLAGLMGLYGYSAYSASKFAVVGMAQALQMEVKPYGIGVTVSFPPDTDTRGFAEEMKTKLLETQLISESGGMYSAEDVAVKTLDDSLRGKFASTLGFDGWALKTLCSGSFPVTSYFHLFVQCLTMGFLRLFLWKYLWDADKKIKGCNKDKKL